LVFEKPSKCNKNNPTRNCTERISFGPRQKNKNRKGRERGTEGGDFLFGFLKGAKIVRPFVYLRMLARANLQKLR
jgi:hypothetical protein